MNNSVPLIPRVEDSFEFSFPNVVPYSLDGATLQISTTTKGTLVPASWRAATEVHTDDRALRSHLRHDRFPLLNAGGTATLFSDSNMGRMREKVVARHQMTEKENILMGSTYFTAILAWERMQQVKRLMAIQEKDDVTADESLVPSARELLASIGLEKATRDNENQTDVVDVFIPKRRKRTRSPPPPPLPGSITYRAPQSPKLFLLQKDGTVFKEAEGCLLMGRGVGELNEMGDDFVDISFLSPRPKSISRLHVALFWDEDQKAYVVLPYGRNTVTVNDIVLPGASGSMVVKSNSLLTISDVTIQLRYGRTAQQ